MQEKCKTGQTCFSNLLGAIEDSSIVPELWAGANDGSCYGYHETNSDSRPRRLGMLQERMLFGGTGEWENVQLQLNLTTLLCVRTVPLFGAIFFLHERLQRQANILPHSLHLQS